jgi:hypothetical protein
LQPARAATIAARPSCYDRASMVLNAIIGVTLILTQFVPIYPKQVDASVLAFLGLVSVAGMLALMHRVARRELLVLSLWLVPLAIGALVGSLGYGDAQQIVEDTVPYGLFVLGLLAGRGSVRPHRVLLILLAVCFIESLISVVLVIPGYTPGVRSTWAYGRVVSGFSVIGMFVLLFFRTLGPSAGVPRILTRTSVALVLYAVMFVAMLASGSRGMMLGWLAGVALYAYVRSPSRALLATFSLILLALAYSSVLSDVGVRYLRTDQVATIEERFSEVRNALQLFAENPLFGTGLGTSLESGAVRHSYVHNVIVYHLWKFGLVGSFILAVPFWLVGAQIRGYPRRLRAIALGGAIAVFAYLVTCAGYKVYYVVWVYGVAAGAVLSTLWDSRVREPRRLTENATSVAAPPGVRRIGHPSSHDAIMLSSDVTPPS